MAIFAYKTKSLFSRTNRLRTAMMVYTGQNLSFLGHVIKMDCTESIMTNIEMPAAEPMPAKNDETKLVWANPGASDDLNC